MIPVNTVCAVVLCSVASSSPTTYVMEEDEPSFQEEVDYSADSNDDDPDPDVEASNEPEDAALHLDTLSDCETANHKK